MNSKNYLKFLSTMLTIPLLTSCDYFNNGRFSPSKTSGVIKKEGYHFEMTKKEKKIYHNYLAKLSPKEKKEREEFYCGQLDGYTVKFNKDYLFTPLGYSDISFLEPNGWKAKMRWCEDPIISYSIVINWPSLEPGRTLYGFDKLDWGTYNQYLLSNQNDKKTDYSNAVIYAFGQIDRFSEETIRENPKNLKPYLEDMLKKYKVNANKAFTRKDLDLEQLEISLAKDKVITVYWHQYGKNQAATTDLVIECKPVPERLFSWCKSYFFPRNIPNIIASFIVTEDNLANWPQLVNKAVTLFNSFATKNYRNKSTDKPSKKNRKDKKKKKEEAVNNEEGVN